MSARGKASVALVLIAAALAAAPPPSDEGLKTFSAWLDRQHPGYHCDNGPARFQNHTVEVAYPGRRFYYVLTYARGIMPPQENMISVVAEVDSAGKVRPLRPWTAEVFGTGLIRVKNRTDARHAAAGVLVLSMSDPGEGRDKVDEKNVAVTRKHGDWVCSYSHGPYYVSRVTFDKQGRLKQFQVNTPPVP